MDETTQTQAATDSPAQDEGGNSTAFGWCNWHKGHSEGVRLIDVHEQGSGPGGNISACPPCRKIHRLVPLADRP